MVGIIDILSPSQQLELIYIAYYNRAADIAGFNYWESANAQQQAAGVSAGSELIVIANQFGPPQAETLALYPFLGAGINLSSSAGQVGLTTFVGNVYGNLFGRTADAAGLSYWVSNITNGTVQLGEAILAIANGATGSDAIELQNKIAVASDFTTKTAAAGLGVGAPLPATFLAAARSVLTGVDGTALNDPSVAAGKTATAAFITASTAPPPNPLSLTLGTDNLTTATAAAVFTAPLAFNSGTGTQIQTLQTGDTLADSANDGTLTATLNAGLLVSGFTMSGVKTLNVTAINAAGAGDGFSGDITGLQVVNNNASTEAVFLGLPGTGLKTALTTYNSNNVSNTGVSGIVAFVAASALSGSADAISITLTGKLGTANTTGTGATTVSALIFAPDAGTNGYETWTITANNAAFLYLGQGQGTAIVGSGLGSGAHIVLNGAGSVELNAGIAGDWANLKTVDASAATGSVTLTGAAANAAGGYASAAGTGLAGLLTSGASVIAPTSIKGSATAANFVDLSGLTLANTDAMTGITGNTAAGISNTLLLNNAVVEQSAVLAGESGFQIIGDTALAAGTVNMANFAGANELKLFGRSALGTGTVTINGGPSAFALDLSGDSGPAATSVFVVNGPAGTTDAFHLILGSTTNLAGGGGGLSSIADAFNAVTATGYEAVDVTNNVGNGASSNFVGTIAVTPSAGGGASVTFDGTAFLSVSSITLGLGGGTITDTLTGAQLWFGQTNAAVITEGAGAGGLEQFGQPTGNNGNTGISIALHSAAGTVNNVIGSVGADTITGSGGTDVILPNGGTNPTAGATFGDSVTLGAGHTADHVELYGFGSPGSAFGTAANHYGGLAGSITAAGDLAQPGFWGVGVGGTPVVDGGLAANTGTSASQVQINGFLAGAGADVIDLSVSAWTVNPPFFGVYDSDFSTPPAIGSNANISAPVGSGGTVTDSNGGLNPTNIVLMQGQFANANILAASLHGTNPIKLLLALGAGNDVHILFLYNDGNNNAHLADVDFLANAGAQSNTSLLTEHVSDMAEMVGVNANSLVGANFHFVA